MECQEVDTQGLNGGIEHPGPEDPDGEKFVGKPDLVSGEVSRLNKRFLRILVIKHCIYHHRSPSKHDIVQLVNKRFI